MLIFISHSGFALLTRILPDSFIPPPTPYSRPLINIRSNSSSLNLLSIASPFIFSCFSFYYLALLSYSFPHLPVSCYICVFPFSVCHHKLPVISFSPPQCHSFVLLLTCPSRPPTLLHKRRAFRHPEECACCNGEVYLVTAGSFHRCLHTRTHPFIVQYSEITTHCLLRPAFCCCESLFLQGFLMPR